MHKSSTWIIGAGSTRDATDSLYLLLANARFVIHITHTSPLFIAHVAPRRPRQLSPEHASCSLVVRHNPARATEEATAVLTHFLSSSPIVFCCTPPLPSTPISSVSPTHRGSRIRQVSSDGASSLHGCAYAPLPPAVPQLQAEGGQGVLEALGALPVQYATQQKKKTKKNRLTISLYRTRLHTAHHPHPHPAVHTQYPYTDALKSIRKRRIEIERPAEAWRWDTTSQVWLPNEHEQEEYNSLYVAQRKTLCFSLPCLHPHTPFILSATQAVHRREPPVRRAQRHEAEPDRHQLRWCRGRRALLRLHG